MALLYFIPGAKALSPPVIAAHGLAHLSTGVGHVETYRGPRGAGLLVSDNRTPAELLRYDPDQQDWSERFGLDSLVGTWHDHKVTPQHLQRETLIQGQSIELLDGQQWTVPILRQWRDGDDQLVFKCLLPSVMQQSPSNGRFILGAVIPQYRQLWESSLVIAQQILIQLSTSAPVELEDESINQFAIDLLAANYRLDASVVSHLQLLTLEHCSEIVCAALDLATLRHSLKNLYRRRTSGGTNTESGNQPLPTDSTTLTDPPPPS